MKTKTLQVRFSEELINKITALSLELNMNISETVRFMIEQWGVKDKKVRHLPKVTFGCNISDVTAQKRKRFAGNLK